MWIAMIAATVSPLGPVRVEPAPLHPYAEQTGSGVDVDGDLIVANDGGTALGIDEISVEVRDSGGRLLQRKEWNSNGTSPSIRMLNVQSVPAHGRVLVFNPFAHFAADVPVARLDYELTMSPEGKPDQVKAQTRVDVRSEPKLRFAFPLKGRVLVWDGHDAAAHHRRWDYLKPMLAAAGYASNSARYSLDLILVDAEGRRSTGDEGDNRNWPSFGAPVLALASGEVIAARDDLADDRRFDVATVTTPNALYGNHVVVRHSDGSYSMYGHLRQGSVIVKVGQQVGARQKIARVGASGSALFPHLHVQRMDGPNDRSEGVPTRFNGIVRPSGREPANGFVDSGDVLIAR